MIESNLELINLTTFYRLFSGQFSSLMKHPYCTYLTFFKGQKQNSNIFVIDKHLMVEIKKTHIMQMLSISKINMNFVLTIKLD